MFPEDPLTVIISCPKCRETLREDLTHGQFYCGYCNLAWPLATVIESLSQFMVLLNSAQSQDKRT